MEALHTRENEVSCLDGLESRERFLRWHYRHSGIYLRLRELALAECEGSRKPITIDELISRFEEDQTLKGCEAPTETREYAHYYQGLLSSSLTLWRLFRQKTVSRHSPVDR